MKYVFMMSSSPEIEQFEITEEDVTDAFNFRFREYGGFYFAFRF